MANCIRPAGPSSGSSPGERAFIVGGSGRAASGRGFRGVPVAHRRDETRGADLEEADFVGRDPCVAHHFYFQRTAAGSAVAKASAGQAPALPGLLHRAGDGVPPAVVQFRSIRAEGLVAVFDL